MAPLVPLVAVDTVVAVSVVAVSLVAVGTPPKVTLGLAVALLAVGSPLARCQWRVAPLVPLVAVDTVVAVSVVAVPLVAVGTPPKVTLGLAVALLAVGAPLAVARL